MKPITEAIASMAQAISTLTTNLTTMQQDIQDLKDSQKTVIYQKINIPQHGIRKSHPNTKCSWNILIVAEMNSTLPSIKN